MDATDGWGRAYRADTFGGIFGDWWYQAGSTSLHGETLQISKEIIVACHGILLEFAKKANIPLPQPLRWSSESRPEEPERQPPTT